MARFRDLAFGWGEGLLPLSKSAHELKSGFIVEPRDKEGVQSTPQTDGTRWRLIGNRRVREGIPALSGTLGGSSAGLATGQAGDGAKAASGRGVLCSRGILTAHGQAQGETGFSIQGGRSATGCCGPGSISVPPAYLGFLRGILPVVSCFSLGKKCFARWLLVCRSGRSRPSFSLAPSSAVSSDWGARFCGDQAARLFSPKPCLGPCMRNVPSVSTLPSNTAYLCLRPSDWRRPAEWSFARLMYPPGPLDGYRGRFDGDWRQGCLFGPRITLAQTARSPRRCGG